MVILITVLDLTISLFVLVLSLFVLLRDPSKKLNQIFGITILFFSSWIISSSLSDITGFAGSTFWALWFARASIIGPLLFCPLFLYFTYYFPREIHAPTPLKTVGIFAIPVLSLFLFPTKYNVESVSLESWGTGFIPGQLYLVLLICLMIYFGFSLYRLTKAYRQAVYYHEKSQIFYVFIGVITFVTIGIITNIILPGVGIAQFSVFGPALSMLIFGSLTAYAILKHHLLETWLVVRTGTIFAILFSIIAFAYVTLSGFIGSYIGGLPALFIVSLLITLTFEPLKKFIENKTDRIFFSKHYNFDQVIEEFTSTAHHADLDLDKILISFTEIITRNFKVGRVAVAILTPKGIFSVSPSISGINQGLELMPYNPLVGFLSANQNFILNKDEILQNLNKGDKEMRLEVDRIDLLPGAYEELVKLDLALAIPVVAAEKLIAIYFVSNKTSNDFFTNQDLKLLDHLTGEAGVLINNARLYEDLKKLDDAKSNFISVVSHQLRTPLSGIRWSMELLLDGSVDKASEREFINDSYKNSLFIIYQLDDMLTALDLEGRKVEIHAEKCVLRPLIEEILKDNKVIIQGKKLEISLSLPEKMPTIFCDCKKIKKAVEILIRNAIRYTPDSGGKIAIDVQEKNEGDERLVEVSVTDNGLGISGEEEHYIFGKFFRGEGAKKISPNGFGLGLFIVKAFALAHGGDAHFESGGRDKGARFYFTVRSGEPS